jgi:hypothetical protein
MAGMRRRHQESARSADSEVRKGHPAACAFTLAPVTSRRQLNSALRFTRLIRKDLTCPASRPVGEISVTNESNIALAKRSSVPEYKRGRVYVVSRLSPWSLTASPRTRRRRFSQHAPHRPDLKSNYRHNEFDSPCNRLRLQIRIPNSWRDMKTICHRAIKQHPLRRETCRKAVIDADGSSAARETPPCLTKLIYPTFTLN